MRILVPLFVLTLGSGCMATAYDSHQLDSARSKRSTYAVPTANSGSTSAAIFAASPTQISAPLRPTSLIESPLDTAVIERLVRQRMGAVTQRGLRDLLKKLGVTDGVPLPLTDLVGALASLVTETSDAETRSQVLVAAVVRDGLSAGIAVAAASGAFDRAGCGGATAGKTPMINDLMAASYEGLAASSYLRSLGFPASSTKGEVPPNCATFKTRVTGFVDLLGTVGVYAEQAKGLAAELGLAKTACGGSVTVALPADLRAALMALPASLGTANVRQVLDLRQAVADARRELATMNPPVGGFDACVTALNQVALSAEGALGKISPAAETFSLDTLTTEITKAMALQSTTGKDDPVVATLKTILINFASNQRLSRGDVVSLIELLRQNLPPNLRVTVDGVVDPRSNALKLGAELLDVAILAIEEGIRETPSAVAGIRLDVPAIATTMLARFVDQKRPGFYVRATVGLGFISTPDGRPWFRVLSSSQQQASLSSSFHEEIGVGYRWALGDSLLFGPHAFTSGLLYRLSINKEAQDQILIGGGVSFNVYQLIDVSGGMGALTDGNGHWTYAFVVSLQIPLADYLAELATGAGAATATQTNAKTE